MMAKVINVQEGELVEVTLQIRVPARATDDEVEEWLRFELGRNGHMAGANPLSKYSPEIWGEFGFDLNFKGYIGVREEYDRQEHPDGRTTYKVRYREVEI